MSSLARQHVLLALWILWTHICVRRKLSVRTMDAYMRLSIFMISHTIISVWDEYLFIS